MAAERVPGLGLSSRRGARERALELLYEAETKELSVAAIMEALPLDTDRYAAALVNGVEEHVDELDHLIEAASHDWSVRRMPAVDRALLRMAAYELAHRPDVPVGVVLAEAVELAAEYSTESSSKFVNGVLATLAGRLRDAPAAAATEP
jgi:transcription antitermination protein NusB